MAGDKDWNRICAAGAADGAPGLRFADSPRDFAVAACFTAGDFSQCAPDVLLKSRAAGQIERWKIFRFAPGESVFQRGCGRAMPAENCGRDAGFLGGSRGHSPHRWKTQSGQSSFRIARDEFSGARGNGQFGGLGLHRRFIQ